MITNFQLLRNVGRFHSFVAEPGTVFKRLTAIYAENGRGKTTLAAILRSLSTNNPLYIMERQRLGVQDSPHVVINTDSNPQQVHIFQHGGWSQNLPDMAVFDDAFVNENIYSGLAVGTEHRQNMHELIIGAQGVTLSRQLQACAEQIEAINIILRNQAAAVDANGLGQLSVDVFCALPPNEMVDAEIFETESHLLAAQQRVIISESVAFGSFSVPIIDLAQIERILSTTIQDLDAAAMAQVKSHALSIGEHGETWLQDGMRRQLGRAAPDTACVFCDQDLGNSPIIAHYRAYFSDAYAALRLNIEQAIRILESDHGNEASTRFERSLRTFAERQHFWSRFNVRPEVGTVPDDFIVIWKALSGGLIGLLKAKLSDPMVASDLPEEIATVAENFAETSVLLCQCNTNLEQANAAIAALKIRSANANVGSINETLAQLNAVKKRYTGNVADLCDAYIATKTSKTQAEASKDAARAALEQYRNGIFPLYQAAINQYLNEFNAGFHLENIAPTNIRGGSACTYNVMINNVPVPVNGAVQVTSFKNTLSAGDRNSLALAFFFASLELDLNRGNKIVVIDDPISSLDDHRSLTTVQVLRRFYLTVNQIIVLSHNKAFLCQLYAHEPAAAKAAYQVTRQANSSNITAWNIHSDSITEHDRRHELIRTYVANGGQNHREIATAIRPLLEAFLRVSFPEQFPPETLLGPFRNACINSPTPILNAADLLELANLTEYGNRFHHDTNPAYLGEQINAGQLTQFANRALNFARRR
ncbi:AAA family ATPase [Undibacterium sp. TJN25]|uniref:AAA family ATPase n=1 Tax=Undibacterium sp. TJN25 TaxID=3413056 RepID=UPI003BF05286